jgi:hypothetical protein
MTYGESIRRKSNNLIAELFSSALEQSSDYQAFLYAPVFLHHDRVRSLRQMDLT